MKRYLIYFLLAGFVAISQSACKAKHCVALEDGMEGYDAKKVRKKKGRQEGLGRHMRVR